MLGGGGAEGRVWGLGEKGEGIEKLQNSLGDVKCSIGNTVNNIVMTVGYWKYQGEYLVKYVII